MIYPDVSLDEWSVRYKIEVESKKCANCGRIFCTSIPVIIRGYVGLETPEHECGPNFKAAVFVPNSEEKLKLWKSVI